MAAAEQRKSYAVVKDFKGVNTKNNRTVIGDGEFGWLENVQPVGFGNLRTIESARQLANVTFANNVASLHSVNINNTEYVLAFQENGGAQYVVLSSGTLGNIASSGTFSNTGVMVTQWKNERALIIDPNKGYKSWDGTNLVKIGAVNSVILGNPGSGYSSAPTITISGPSVAGGVTAQAEAILVGSAISEIVITEAGIGYSAIPTITFSGGGGTGASATLSVLDQDGIDIATFAGRTWIAEGRTVYYTAPDTYNDFASEAAGFLTITDSTLRTDITRILAANNFLYVFGEDSINVFSDVRVNANTGITEFTNTNVSASVGSELKRGIFPYFRSILFLNKYGVYALVGATTTKISDPLDGIFPEINFNEPVSGGQCLINNILCAVYNFKYNDNGTERWIQAAFFERKWFFTNQLTDCYLVVPAVENGLLQLLGTTGTDLHQFYIDATVQTQGIVETALLPMGDPIRDKQALKIGIEATLGSQAGTLTAYVDSESNQSPAIDFSSTVQWTNYLGNIISWSNSSGTIIGWSGPATSGQSGYFLYKSDAQMYGKYLGITIETTSTPFTINGFQFEHELRARF